MSTTEGSEQEQQQNEHTTTNNNNIAPEDAYDNSQNDETINTIETQNSFSMSRNLDTNEANSHMGVDSPPPPPQYSELQMQQEHAQQQNGIAGLGITLMQSSPPPHSYRHSRAYRHFKNPPQPHMCIRTTTEAGEELFINVLSWTRIVIPQEPSDPIPLYGGMRVPPGSPRSPPIVFAVMANPEVLKDSGRHSKDAEERRAMVELMCDFVEAMNPGVKLVRNAVILKDRDISGELKDVWNAVQAQRDREREEQMLAQRQQQHYQNITTQQMFPKSPDASAARSTASAAAANQTALNGIEHELTNGVTPISLEVFAQQLDNKVACEQLEHSQETSEKNVTNVQIEKNNTIECFDQTDASAATNTMNGNNASPSDNQNSANVLSPGTPSITSASTSSAPTTTANAQTFASNAQNATNTATTEQKSNNTNNATNTNAISNANNTANNAPPATPINVPPPKKEKLGGFLPNGCIFPRFKNNKNKDKDNQKESKSKEKTLLNALKSKSKEKKVAPIEQHQNATNNDKTSTTTTTTDATQYEKNCINNLESEVQKLDLNKIETSASNDMFIKLKVASNTATAATAAAK